MTDDTTEPSPSGSTQPGPSQDAGWQVGVRTTVSAPLAMVWSFLIGEGLPLWLGDIDSIPMVKGEGFETRDGVRGSIRSYTMNQSVRLTWQPADWPHGSTLHLTVKKVPGGTRVSIEHEHLVDRDERKMMLGHWKNVAAHITERFER